MTDHTTRVVADDITRAIHAWVREDAPLAVKFTWTPDLQRKLERKIALAVCPCVDGVETDCPIHGGFL